jgi:hypothetical protein
MAKVFGPLHSDGATGKLADAIVFFPWKGNNVVRKWLKPTNKKSAAQGVRRCIMGGTGRACGEILPRPGNVTISNFAQALITLKLIPGGQTKQSFMVNYILNHYLTDATTYAAMLAEMTGNTTVFTALGTIATTLGLVDYSVTYDGVANYDKALGLYLIAKSAIALGFTVAPYTTPLASWAAADCTLFGADLTAA